MRLFISVLSLIYSLSCLAMEMPEHVKLDKIARIHLKKMSEAIAKEFQIELMSVQTGAMIDSKQVVWCSKYMIRHSMSIEEMRPIVHGMFKAYWIGANSEPSYEKSIIIAAQRPSILYSSRVFSPNLFGLKIVFWDMEMNRPLHPYVAQIVVKESKIHYYYADPKTQALIEPPVVEEFPKGFF